MSLAGHRHPKVIEAVTAQLGRATVYGASHSQEAELAEVILERYPFHEQVLEGSIIRSRLPSLAG